MSHLTFVAPSSPSLKSTATGTPFLPAQRGAVLRNGRTSGGPLQTFLDAELAPGLSIEEACYPSIALLEMRSQPTLHEQVEARRLLDQAGLIYLEHDAFEPGHVIIEQPLKFAARLPHMEYVIPFVLRAKGVWVLSDASPVEDARPRLVP